MLRHGNAIKTLRAGEKNGGPDLLHGDAFLKMLNRCGGANSLDAIWRLSRAGLLQQQATMATRSSAPSSFDKIMSDAREPTSGGERVRSQRDNYSKGVRANVKGGAATGAK